MNSLVPINIAVILLAAVAGNQAQTTFTQMTNSPIVNDIGMFTMGAWADFNHDGFLDLFLCNWGRTNVFYRNNGVGAHGNGPTCAPRMDPPG